MAKVQGRWTDNWWCLGIVVFGILSMTISLAIANDVEYNVGDDKGWAVNVNYSDWAAKQTFHEGDTVVFSYPRGSDNVLRVSPEDFESCTVSNPIETDESGQSAFQLTMGTSYFISGFPAHCDMSQKVSFNVDPSPGSVSSPQAETSSDVPNYNQGAETPIAYGPTGAFAPGSASLMSRPSLLHLLYVVLTFGYLLGSCSSIL